MILAFSVLLWIIQCELVDIDGITVQKHDNAILLDGPNIQQSPQSFDVTDLGDLLARTFWAGQIKPHSPVELDHNTPSSNLFIVNFGPDESILHANPLSGSQSDLVYNFFPADSVSLLTSMATSKLPNEHGVVGSSWFVGDKEMHAYDDATAFSSHNSFSQLIDNAHNDMKIVSASADPKLATAISQNPESIDSLTNGVFSSQHGIGFTQDDMLHSLLNDDFWKQFAGQIAQLDLSDSSVISFLMECEYLRRMTDLMTSTEPTLYNVATTTPSVPAAHEILVGTLDHVTSAFKENHPEGSSQVAFLKEPEITKTTEESAQRQHYHPKQMYETLTNGTVIQDSRSYQFSICIALFVTILMYMFVSQFAYMRYEDDATLFTKWQRGAMDSKMASAMGRGDFGGPDMRAFNIH